MAKFILELNILPTTSNNRIKRRLIWIVVHVEKTIVGNDGLE